MKEGVDISLCRLHDGIFCLPTMNKGVLKEAKLGVRHCNTISVICLLTGLSLIFQAGGEMKNNLSSFQLLGASSGGGGVEGGVRGLGNNKNCFSTH